MASARRYSYVGPDSLRSLPGPPGASVTCPADLERWLAEQGGAEEPFTFVIRADSPVLRLAPRRSEHVACAGGQEVLAAGEMAFVRAGAGWAVAEVSNQSTGYCPDPSSWPAVAEALDRAGVAHPPGYTTEIIFRFCPVCGERNIVREGDYTCALCDGALNA
jgi:hypothetical protein